MGLGDFLSTRSGIGSIFDSSGDDMLDQLKASQGIWGDVKPGDISYQNYNPVLATANQVTEDPAVLQAQSNYLQKLSGLADTGYSQADQAAAQQAAENANMQERGNRLASLQTAQARGMGGAGMDYALSQMANQNGVQNANMAGLQQAQNQAQMRALYNQAYGQGLSNQRQQNMQPAMLNQQALNQFNLANTNTQNQGQQYNINNAYNAQQQNIANKLNWANGATGANEAMAKGYAAQNAANAQGRNDDTKMFGTILGGVMGGA